MAQLAVVLLALFGQMERTYSLECAAHARQVATAKGRRIGWPSVVSESQLAHAVQFRDAGATAAEIVAKTGLTRSTLYRHLPTRPAYPVTAATPSLPARPRRSRSSPTQQPNRRIGSSARTADTGRKRAGR
ncbi:helix-turn-helix domain-containing protein [Rhodococcus sp. Q1]|uniref:helix-turn-helix domain-containing protein n=1 Tax=Rhodococcus sp. Q1 TaxID=2508718 RepID=UPI001F5CA15A|nr:helix-turn-helix domain-containing protein [Rhodococcus sp. Q1]